MLKFAVGMVHAWNGKYPFLQYLKYGHRMLGVFLPPCAQSVRETEVEEHMNPK